jgi:hypothetical protein
LSPTTHGPAGWRAGAADIAPSRWQATLAATIAAAARILGMLAWYVLARCMLYLAVMVGLSLVALSVGGQRLRQFAAGIRVARRTRHDRVVARHE